jgi:hypothetical protein
MTIHKHDNQGYLDAADQSLAIADIKTGVNAGAIITARNLNIANNTSENFHAWSADGGTGHPEHLKLPYTFTVKAFTFALDEEGMGRWNLNTGVTCTLRLRADTAGGTFATETYSKVIAHNDMVAAQSGVDDAYFSLTGLSTAIAANQYVKFSMQWSNAVVPGGSAEFYCAFIINIATP